MRNRTVNVLPAQEKTSPGDSGLHLQKALGRLLYKKGMRYLSNGFQRKGQDQQVSVSQNKD